MIGKGGTKVAHHSVGQQHRTTRNQHLSLMVIGIDALRLIAGRPNGVELPHAYQCFQVDHAAMVPEWEANTVFVAAELAGRFPQLFTELEAVLAEHGVPLRLLEGARDIWARDFMPVQVGESEFVRFRYEPDYLRDDYRELLTGEEACRSVPLLQGYRRADIILDGGNVVGSRDTAVLTDKVFRENAGWGRGELAEQLRALLRVQECAFLPPEPGDIFGHADGVVRFVQDGLVVVNDYSTVDHRYGQRLQSVLRCHGLNWEVVPYFVEDVVVDGVPSAVGCYVNYLRVQQVFVVPAYGVSTDEIARRQLARLVPGTPVVSVDCLELARQGGVLNCVTWTVRAQERSGRSSRIDRDD